MGEILKFDLMHEDEKCSHVEINFETGEIKNIDYIDDPIFTVFGNNPVTLDIFEEFLEDRVFSKDRPDVDVLCNLLGIKGFNPLEIVKVTHGMLLHDFIWMRFEGEENLKYKDIRKVR